MSKGLMMFLILVLIAIPIALFVAANPKINVEKSRNIQHLKTQTLPQALYSGFRS